MNSRDHVFVAMSGGVDSALSAEILLSRGYKVTGIHMETWKDPKWSPGNHPSEESVVLAKKTAEMLGIPFVSLDLKQRFYSDVVQPFIKKYLAGETPNPCLFCNPQVKWGVLQSYAFEQGAAYFATGHYARLSESASGIVKLFKAKDKTKDQSYVLSMLNQQQLQRTLLPLGDMRKADVRVEAKKRNLPTAEQQDSQDLCFLGSIDYRDFLQRYAPDSIEPGEIVDVEDKVIGKHLGLPFYTIGQRKGIRVASSEPYYVTGKDVENNRLIVGHAHQAGQRSLLAHHLNWIAGEPPAVNEIYDVMIRYRAKPVPAMLSEITSDNFRLKFIKEQRGITPGQVAVLYKGEECLGGGTIQIFG
jgi:tRNA-specific 2-thiouridylase